MLLIYLRGVVVADLARAILAVNVVWHPNYSEGSDIAELIFEHFRSERYKNVLGNVDLNVAFHSAPAPGTETPVDIDLNEAETSAVVVLAEAALAADSAWRKYVDGVINDANARGFGARVFPVAVEETGLDVGFEIQALRWDRWEGNDAERSQRLIRELSYEFSRMLRHYLEHVKHPVEEDTRDLERYLEKVPVFLSHSKHDGDGERIARDIRDWLHQNSGLSSFFDVLDIPAGTPFQEVLELHVKRSALVAVHTDSYSSREWCRREIIEAKRCNVPMILVNCVRDVDQRCFPYMGNVPNVRLDPGKEDPNRTSRIERVIGCLLDEVFKAFLWRCRIELADGDNPHVLFMARPPELISLANIEQGFFENPESFTFADPPTGSDVPDPVIVYPDPPLGAEEEQLFERIMPRVQLRHLSQWLTEA